jgi:hypothetical protein
MATLVTKIDMDNGSFPLAKDALRSLAKTTLNGAHRALIDVVWMETYGWHDSESKYQEKIKQRRVTAKIPHSVFEEETWMDKSTVSRRLNELVRWKIIFRDKNTTPYNYSFNVNVSEWSPEIFRKTKNAQPVNSLQNNQQLTTLPTNSLTPSQLRVDYPVNSCDVKTLDFTGTHGTPKESIKESIKENTSTIVDEQAQVKIDDQKPTKPKKTTKKPKYSEDDKAIANYLKEKLQNQGVTAFPRDWHLKEYAVAHRLLKSSNVLELKGCIDWLFKDEYWHNKTDSLLVVERQLPKYQLQKGGISRVRGDPNRQGAFRNNTGDDNTKYGKLFTRKLG